MAFPVLATGGYSLSWAHFQIYFLSNVTLWLLYSLILFIVPNHYGGKGPFFAVMQNVGYSMVPIALHNVVSILVILWFKLQGGTVAVMTHVALLRDQQSVTYIVSTLWSLALMAYATKRTPIVS